MTNAGGHTWLTLTREQYDIAWHDLELGEQPYTIAIRTHGKTTEERAMIRSRVYGELAARRLANGRRLEPDLEAMLTLVARAPVRIELSWLPRQGAKQMRNAVATRTGEAGVVAELNESELRLATVRGTAVVHELLGLLPQHGAAHGQSVSLPLEALAPAGGGGRHAESEAGGSIYESNPAVSAGARHQVRSLELLLATPRVRGGHIEITVLDRYGRRTNARPLEWFDTEDGRCMAQFGAGPDGREHLTVTPADNAKIANRLYETIDKLVAG